MDDRFDDRSSSQRGGSGAGVGGSCFHARMKDCLDGFPSNVEVLALVLVVSAFMPEWTIVSMIVLPPNVEVLAPVSMVPAFMPEWTIVSTIVLPPNVEALAQVSVVPNCMPQRWISAIIPPESTIISTIIIRRARVDVLLPVTRVQAVIPGLTNNKIVLMIVPESSTVSTMVSGLATVSTIVNLTKVQVLPPDSIYFCPNAANGNGVGGDDFFSRSSVLNSSLQNYHDDDHFTEPRRYDYHANQETGHGYEHHASFLPLASCSDVHKHAYGRGLPLGQSFLPCSTVSTVKERDGFCS
jgi:hypothetical protein